MADEKTRDPMADNLETWEAWTRIHVDSDFYDVASFRDETRPIRLRDYELAEIGPVAGQSLLHIQCHFGLDTLSWARLGARVTGADFSPAAIEAATSLASDAGIDARFVLSSVYDLPQNLDGTFDIVYTSRGVLGWLPDIRRWAQVVGHFVKPGGFFYITEAHPIAMIFDDENVEPGELRLAYPYWEHELPLTFEVKGSYADRDAPTQGLVEHGWDHSLGEIVSALAEAGLHVEFLHEFDFLDWELGYLVKTADGMWRLPPGTKGQLPLFFSLRASKPA
jgi:SAM-dependent methyltransferase